MTPRDTDPRAWDALMGVFRDMTPQERVAIAVQMSEEVRALARMRGGVNDGDGASAAPARTQDA